MMTSKYQSGVRVSEYLLEEQIGGGTFGEVWRARHHVWENTFVAIKLPTEPEYVRFLRTEGVVVHGLRHPNIIRVLGLDPYAEVPYLVMELVEGPSLRQVLDEHPHGLPLDTVYIVMCGILRAMSAAHAGGVIHRDLKPGNVLLHLAGRPLDALRVDDVKVGDFGLGVPDADALRSMIVQSASIARDEQSGTIAGTIAYMAPELRDGRVAASPASDLFSAGVVLFELLTGERPAGAELPSTLHPEVPHDLDELFRKLYARQDRRYPSADEALTDLARLMDATTTAPAAPAVPPVPATPPAPAPTPANSSGMHHKYVTCPNCDHPVEIADQFCTQCGAQLVSKVRRCETCGGYPALHDRFCIYCGAGLEN